MRWWFAAAVFWTLLIMAVCWLPIPMFPTGIGGEHPKSFPHFDKVVHASIFAVFGLLWLRVIPGNRRFLVVMVAGAALAVITEYGQSLPIIGRDGDVADGLADVCGVFLAYPLSMLLFRRVREEPPVASMTRA
jgi:VanZ family protein